MDLITAHHLNTIVSEVCIKTKQALLLAPCKVDLCSDHLVSGGHINSLIAINTLKAGGDLAYQRRVVQDPVISGDYCLQCIQYLRHCWCNSIDTSVFFFGVNIGEVFIWIGWLQNDRLLVTRCSLTLCITLRQKPCTVIETLQLLTGYDTAIFRPGDQKTKAAKGHQQHGHWLWSVSLCTWCCCLKFDHATVLHCRPCCVHSPAQLPIHWRLKKQQQKHQRPGHWSRSYTVDCGVAS